MTGNNNGKGNPYSIPRETQKIFENGILQNPLIAPTLPKEIEECSKTIRFEGSDTPSIPINWRFAESISALKGLEAAMVNVLLKQKYGVEPQEAVINTNHAQLFFMSILLNTIDPKGEAIDVNSVSTPEGKAAYQKYFKNCDLHNASNSVYRTAATNIYRCKDGRYFHLHGSMNPGPTQDSIGLPHDMHVSAPEEAYAPYQEKLSKIDSGEMQSRASDTYKQAGTICFAPSEFKDTAHAKANTHTGLFSLHAHANPLQKACWWPSTPQTSPARPLAGLKVVDITRVIAAPALTRGLAELGASVMRVTAQHITDMSSLHVDLNWGKWNTHLDFRSPSDLSKLHALILDADVVVSGYRPSVLDKYGLDVDSLLELTEERERGLIVIRENCYGWEGEWQGRSGWQQISDACCGVSSEFGRGMGLDEPVTPVFPNSDFCTGVAGVVGVLNAVVRRGVEGGSWRVDVALNYYSQWLVNSVGMYPEDIWQDVWTRNGRQVFRHYHNMQYTLPRYLQMMRANASDVLFKPEFFETRHSGAIGVDVQTVKPIVQYPDAKVELKFNVGTRGNGVDLPRWPEDLMTEVVA